MNIFSPSVIDLIGTLVGFTLTIFIFSYIWGDNALFRIATHLFIGVAAGYVCIVTINNVILPQLIFPLLSENRGEMLITLVFLVFGALLLTKMSPRLAHLGNPAVAFLVGIGAAVAIGGVVMGTVFPQTAASMDVLNTNQSIVNGVVILLGTLATLIYFHFGTRRKSERSNQRAIWMEGLSYIGQTFIAITFGALFTGVYIAALTALIERFGFIWSLLKDLILSL